MKWIPDSTGRFHERPYYPQKELDDLSEGWVVGFLVERYGKAEFPISTEDLTVMIESDTSDVDHYADLSSEEGEGEEVQGMTLFYPDKKPMVKVAQQLAGSGHRLQRLRTTLTHEFGHVKLHGKLWPFNQARLFPDQDESAGPRCKRGTILEQSRTDWMEWQAGYVSGAILMPITRLRTTDLPASSGRTTERFDVSQRETGKRWEAVPFEIRVYPIVTYGHTHTHGGCTLEPNSRIADRNRTRSQGGNCSPSRKAKRSNRRGPCKGPGS